MNKLEDLVPDLELCKQIPDGAFADSALVWDSDYERWYVTEREKADPDIAIPAPTLAEIMADCPDCFARRYKRANPKWAVIFLRKYERVETVAFDETTPATAAMKLWLELNKSDQSDTDRKGGEQ